MVCVTKQYVNLSVADNIVALFEYQLSQIKINKRATSVYILPIAKFTQYAFWALTIHVIVHTNCPFVTQLVQQFVIFIPAVKMLKVLKKKQVSSCNYVNNNYQSQDKNPYQLQVTDCSYSNNNYQSQSQVKNPYQLSHQLQLCKQQFNFQLLIEI